MTRRLLTLLLVLLLARAASASTTSYIPIPGSALKAASGAGTNCKGTCGGCVPGLVGADNKSVWTCTNLPLTDQGVEFEFTLPPFALSTTISMTVIFSDSASTGQAGFYGYFEITPLALVPGVWANNIGQDCDPSATTQATPLHGNLDTQAVIAVATCNQSTAATCASVVECTGSKGYHGIGVVYRDNTSFSPNLNGSLTISEIVIGVTTP